MIKEAVLGVRRDSAENGGDGRGRGKGRGRGRGRGGETFTVREAVADVIALHKVLRLGS